MGGLPSREASDDIRTLRYGNHEIGLIPLTRQFFNKENPELCQQFIRVRNDPNVRYCHIRPPGYRMDELPPAEYTQADLDAYVDTIEASLFDTNAEFLNAGAGAVTPLTVSQIHRILQQEGLVDPVEEKEPVAPDMRSTMAALSKRVSADTTTTENSNNGMTATESHLDAPSTPRESESESASQTNAAVANDSVGVVQPTGGSGEEHNTPAQNVANTFHRLKSELQSSYREAEKGDGVDYTAQAATLPDLFESAVYRRFKRAVRPVTCAVVFIYVNSREEHDCFTFRGHRINVIGCFGLRTYEDASDDTVPVLQIRKGIIKAAGDRTLERVLALAATSFVDSFTDVVRRELQQRPAAALLKGIGEEARGLLRELPPSPLHHEQQTDSATALLGGSSAGEPNYEPVSVANALFFEWVSKCPLLCVGLFNNYPTLKFIFDFSALAISVEEGRAVRKEPLRLCTFQRGNDERALAFLYPARLLAYTWLWSATQTQPPTVRDAWVQYTLNEYAQSRERRVQQWLETSTAAKVMLGTAASTRLFLEHLDSLHSEIVRARTTSTADEASWAAAQEYSHDAKLYRIFISPVCGPLLTTVKEPKGEPAARGTTGGAKKAHPRPRSPLRSTQPSSTTRAGTENHANNGSDATSDRADGDDLASQKLSSAPNPTGLDSAKGSTATFPTPANPSAAAAGLKSVVAPPYPHGVKLPSVHVGAREESGGGTAASSKRGTAPPPPPPSYSAVSRGTYPLPTVATYPTQPSPQPMYLQGGCIAVPTTPSGASWMVPQFLSQPSPSFAGVVSPGGPIAIQQQQPPPPSSPPNAGAASAATYILQIGNDGTQTFMPITVASTAQMNANTNTHTLPTSYQLPAVGPSTMMASGFSPPSSFPGLHQNTAASSTTQTLLPLTSGAGGSAASGGGGVYYIPATSYAPASFITPLRTAQPLYPATAPPTPVSFPYFPSPSASASASVSAATAAYPAPRVEGVKAMDGARALEQPPAYPSNLSTADLRITAIPTQPGASTPLLNRQTVATPPRVPHELHASEDIELFANAFRLLD